MILFGNICFDLFYIVNYILIWFLGGGTACLFTENAPAFCSFPPPGISLSLCLKMKLFEFLSDVRNLWDVDGLSMRGSIWCNEFAFKMSLHPSFLLPFLLFLPSHKISPTCSPLSHSVMYAQSLLCHMRKHSSDIIFAQLWHRALQGPLTLHWNYQQNSPSDETLSVCIQAKGDVCCYFLLLQFKTELWFFLQYIHYIYIHLFPE